MPYQASRALVLLPLTTIGAAVAAGLSTPLVALAGLSVLNAQAVFVYAAGGTSAKFFLQTTLDGGTTWFDVASWAFTTSSATRIHSLRSATAVAPNITPGSKTLTDNTILDGLLGDSFRIAYTTVGIYTGVTTITITAGVVPGSR